MPIIAPLIPAGVTLVKVGIAGGVAYFAGRELVAVFDEETDKRIEDLENQLRDAGADAIAEGAQELEETAVFLIKNIGKLIIEAIELTITSLREAFRGKEIETIMTITAIAIILVAILTLRHEVLTGPGGAGEYMAMNRPRPGDGFLGP